jgi:serine protease AprX
VSLPSLLDEVSPAVLKSARRQTRNALGVDVESKATDEFCVAFGVAPAGTFAEAAGAPVFAETLGPAAPQAPAVLEFSGDDGPGPESPATIAPTLATSVRASVAGALDTLAPAKTALALAVGQARANAARDEFLRQAGQIRDDIERATSALAGGTPGRTRTTRSDRLLVEVCWLNRTIRTSDARSLSSVAGDPQVQRVDLPRRLEPEAGTLDVMLEAAVKLQARLGLTGKGVAVAVIDSEAALGHPALRGRLLHRRNFTQEPWGTPAPHGTAVAGIIGANSSEYTGMAPDAEIHNYKVLSTNPAFNATDFEGALAIQQALEDGIRVANCSWGAGPAGRGTSREARACNRAWRFGLTVVKSAGNLGPGAKTLTTPADAEGVIVVGATGDDGQAVEDYSSRGPTADRRTRPHLVAPGGHAGTGLVGLLAGGGVGDIGWGTSYAAPHISGLLALVLERNPELSPTAQRDALIKACVKLPRVAKNLQGAGLVDLAKL